MKKLLALLALFLLVGMASADSNVTQIFQQKTTNSALEVANNWMVLSIIAIMISIILVAMAYAVGIGFEMPELQAWAGNELVQVFTNAIMIAALIGAIAFIEIVVIGIAASSGINVPECMPTGSGVAPSGATCLQAVTQRYLDNYINTAIDKSKGVLKNNVDAGGWMNRRLGLTCISIYCLQVSVSGTFAAQNVLNMDKYGIVFEYYSNLLSFMESQRFFVMAISFNMAPVVLAIGIVLRSFFFSRKLGGLLMAIAIGVMFFFPGMYIFDWLTLNTVTNGDQAYGQETQNCPSECLIETPLAYLKEGTSTMAFNDTESIYLAFSDENTAEGIINGSLDSAQATTTNSTYFAYNQNVQSCFPYNNGTKLGPNINGNYASQCPTVCRELPYPTAPDCVNLTSGVAYACAAVPAECKVTRLVPSDEINQTEYDSCPLACKSIPPLRSNCDLDATNKNQTGGTCLNSSFECRMAYINESPTFKSRATKPSQASSSVVQACNYAKDCVVSLNASQSCTFVVPPTGTCDDICAGCPSVCRVADFWNGSVPSSQLPSVCTGKDPVTGTDVSAQCRKCHAGCEVTESDLQADKEAATATGNCTSCNWDHLLTGGTNMPYEYTNGNCGDDSCPVQYRTDIPFNVCESCLFDESEYMYNPPINTECSDICKPPDNAPVNQPGTNIGGDGLAGDADIQDLSRLMVPVYVLPLFNIVATLVFIKGLSTFLGGDVEIPGISKVF